MSEILDELRGRIDSLDEHIHDLLMERAAVVAKIGAEKKRAGLPSVQPAREFRVIRRLLHRHRGALPPTVLVRVWRELIGAAGSLQADLRAVACITNEKSQVLWDMARDYFGSTVPVQRVANPLTAISQVREGECAFAIMPWPEDGDENPWWSYLDGDDSGRAPLRIVMRLPFMDRAGQTPDPVHLGLVVARVAFEETGEDRSFLLMDADHSLSRARIVSVAKEAGFTPLSVHSRRSGGPNAPARHLLEVDGYAAPEQVGAFEKKLEDSAVRLLCVGGYPVPPVFEALSVPGDGGIGQILSMQLPPVQASSAPPQPGLAPENSREDASARANS